MNRVKDLYTFDRPGEKLHERGPGALSDTEQEKGDRKRGQTNNVSIPLYNASSSLICSILILHNRAFISQEDA
ncbi:hypothetical protein, partial [Desulfatiferula olefinivorans]